MAGIKSSPPSEARPEGVGYVGLGRVAIRSSVDQPKGSKDPGYYCCSGDPIG